MLETAQHTEYDCVAIGGGLRLPPKSLALFETVINAVHQAAPNAKSPSIRAPRAPPKPLPGNRTQPSCRSHTGA